MRALIITVAGALVLAFAFATAQAAETRTFLGERKAVGNGTIHTWLTEDASGAPLALGVTFTEGILSGLPPTLPYTEYVAPLPKEALTATPFTHFVLNWNPHGHVPAGVYDVPHFDFHFYTITPAQREQITDVGANRALVVKQPDLRDLPAGYITAPGADEPRMGNHWVDSAAPELHGTPFTVTFVYGTYDGQLAFLEPMATVAYLQTKPNFDREIKVPAHYAKPGHYPTHYSLHYDPARGEYRLALEGFVKR